MLNWGSVIGNTVFGPPREDAFGILMYHRIADQPAGYAPLTWNVSPRRFERQIRGLLRRGFDCWPLRKVLEFHNLGRMIPRNVFVITFDDGYANFLRHALPVLLRYRITATMFLPTAYLDSTEPFPFDDWSDAGREDVPRETWQALTTDQCRSLLDSGAVELGAHTHSHQDFRGRPDFFEEDLRQNVAELQRFGIEQPTFAFPFGSPQLGYVTEELVERARAAGVITSLTTESKLVHPHEDPFHWGRYTADGDDTPATLAARLNGWNNVLRECASGMKSLASRARGRWRK